MSTYLIIVIVFLVVNSLIVVFHFEAFRTLQKESLSSILTLKKRIHEEQEIADRLKINTKQVSIDKQLLLISSEIAHVNFSMKEILKGL